MTVPLPVRRGRRDPYRLGEQVVQVSRHRLHAARPASRRHVAVRPDQHDQPAVARRPRLRDDVEVLPVGPQRRVAQQAGLSGGNH